MDSLGFVGASAGTFILDGAGSKQIDFLGFVVLEDTVVSFLSQADNMVANHWSNFTNNTSKTLKAGTVICCDRVSANYKFTKITLTSGCVQLILK